MSTYMMIRTAPGLLDQNLGNRGQWWHTGPVWTQVRQMVFIRHRHMPLSTLTNISTIK